MKRPNAFAASLLPPSAYSVKRDKPDLWPTLVDEVMGALYPAQLDEIQARLDFRPLDLPGGWYDELQEIIQQKREELGSEDLMQIMRDRCDF